MQRSEKRRSRVDSPNYRPRYRRHGSGQARVTIAGRDIYLGPYGTKESHAAYDRVIEGWLANGRQLPRAEPVAVVAPPPAEDEPITVLELLAEYWKMLDEEGHLARWNGTSQLGNFRQAIKPLRELYPAVLADEFGPKMLRRVRRSMIEAELSRSTINARTNTIQRIFKWGTSMELVSVNTYRALLALEPIKKGQIPALDSEPVQPVPEADVFAILPFLSPQVATMVQLQWLTAMRPGEACAMRMRELNRDGPTEQGVKLWIYQPEHHKTEHHGRTRVIPLGPKCQELLRPFLRLDPDAFLFSPADAEQARTAKLREARATPRWPSHARAQEAKKKARPARKLSGSYDEHAYRRAIARACKKAGVSVWSPNRLRHSGATRIRKLHGIEAARVVLGHVSSATTEIYAQMDWDQAVRIMATEG